MCIPSDDGDGAGTNELGDGTWRDGLPGDPCANMLPGDGVPIMTGDGATPG